jgi:hypothetical protein
VGLRKLLLVVKAGETRWGLLSSVPDFSPPGKDFRDKTKEETGRKLYCEVERRHMKGSVGFSRESQDLQASCEFFIQSGAVAQGS